MSERPKRPRNTTRVWKPDRDSDRSAARYLRESKAQEGPFRKSDGPAKKEGAKDGAEKQTEETSAGAAKEGAEPQKAEAAEERPEKPAEEGGARRPERSSEDARRREERPTGQSAYPARSYARTSDRSYTRSYSRGSDRPAAGQPRRGPSKKRAPYSAKERRRKREGFGRLYVDKQIQLQTPMVFVTYDGPVEASIAKRLCYDLDLNVNGEVERLNKLPIKYMFKKEDQEAVNARILLDDRVRAMRLPPLKPRVERFRIDTRLLVYARRKDLPVRITTRGGEVLEGSIDWYSYFEIKLRFGKNAPAVVLFRHAVYDFEIPGKYPSPQRRAQQSSRYAPR